MQIVALNNGLDVFDVAAGIGHVLGIVHRSGRTHRAAEGHRGRFHPVNGPTIARAFLEGGKADRLSFGQFEIGQGNHGTDRVATDVKGEVHDERRVITDKGIVGCEAVGLTVTPTNHHHQINADRLGQPGGVALVGVVLEAGGRVVVCIEQPMVVVAVLHPLGGVIDRRGGDAVNAHRQVQIATLDVGLDLADVAA